jgi:hypothetical protein
MNKLTTCTISNLCSGQLPLIRRHAFPRGKVYEYDEIHLRGTATDDGNRDKPKNALNHAKTLISMAKT